MGSNIDWEKVPSYINWDEVPDEGVDKKDYFGRAYKNLPSSAANFSDSVVNSVVHPIDTATNLGKLAMGGVQNMLPESVNAMLPESFKGNKEISSDLYKEINGKFGSMDAFNESFANDPVGTLSKVSLVTSLPSLALKSGSMAAKLSNAPKTSAQLASKAKDVATIANIADPLNMAAKGVGTASKVITKPVQALSGLLTGLGYSKLGKYTKDAELGKSGTLSAIRGDINVEGIADRADTALGNMAKEMHSEYLKNILPISKDKKILSLDEVVAKLDESDSAVYRKMEKGKFSKGTAAEGTLKELKNTVKDFKIKSAGKPTVMDLDALKQKIFDVGMKNNKPGTLEYRLSKDVYDTVKSTIEQQAPEYAKVMKNYSDMKEEINQIQHVTSLRPGQSHVKSYNKIYNLAKAKPEGKGGASLRVVDKLSKYDPNLMDDLAGLSGHEWSSGRTIGAGSAGSLAGLLYYGLTAPAIAGAAVAGASATSPRLAAETAYKIGQGKRLSRPVIKAADKASLIEYLMEQER
jgi:hypothetical protein